MRTSCCGRLNPRALLDGAFPIDAQRARDARSRASRRRSTATSKRTAAGIVALVDAEMAKVLRIVSVERGHDPRDFTLLAFGGGGPLHACAVAGDIGVARIVVPGAPGVFSAYGLLGRRRARRRRRVRSSRGPTRRALRA